MQKTYIQPQVELSLLGAATTILSVSVLQQMNNENAGQDIQL